MALTDKTAKTAPTAPTALKATGSNGSNGTNGEDGEDGFSTLAIANDEPAGSNCTYGGTKISMGLDNGDGGGTAHDGVSKRAKSIPCTTCATAMAATPSLRWGNLA